MKKPLGEKGNEKENKVKEKEKGLLSKNFTRYKNQKNLIVPRKNKLKNLYMAQESEKPYCTVKEKLSRGLIMVYACYKCLNNLKLLI